MILKKVEKEGLIKAIYKSSNVLASKYNKTNEELTITFIKGTSYTYKDVPMTDYTRFEIAESQGRVLNSRIKKYEFVQNDSIDPAKIIEQIDNMNNEALTALEEDIIKTMDKTIKHYSKHTEMEPTLLKTLQYYISKFQNESNG